MNATRGRPQILQHDQIVDTALEIMDADGLEAVSFRRVGTELGVSHMTLYGYFASKESLLEAMVAHTLEVPATEPRDDVEWDVALADAMREIHTALVARPGIAELLVTQELTGEWVGTVRERLLAILKRAGYKRRDTVDGISVLFNYLLGSVMIETSRHRGGSPRSFDLGLELLIDGLRRGAGP